MRFPWIQGSSIHRIGTHAATRPYAASVASISGLALLSVSFIAGPIRSSRWYVANDIWPTVLGARYVAAGALPFIYESGMSGALPLLPILLAPVVAFGDAVALSIGHPYPVPYPTMWIVLAPVLAAFLVPYSLVLQFVTADVGGWIRERWFLPVGLSLGAVVPLVYGHPEDLVALAGVMVAGRLLLSGGSNSAGYAMAAAIASKQWAVLALPALIVAAPRSLRLGFSARAVLPPAALVVITLVADPFNAWRQLIVSPTQAQFGRSAPWVAGDSVLGTSVPRMLLFFAALLLPLLMRDRSLGSTLTVAGLAVLGRALFEPVLHPYYLGPGLVLVALGLSRARGIQSLIVALVILAWFGVHATGPPWWAGLYCGVAVVYLLAVRELRDRRTHDRRPA